jgi:hypothetical protein
MVTDASHAACAVTTGTGQDHADQSVAVAVSGRFEKRIDRGAGMQVRLVEGKRKGAALLDEKVVVGRRKPYA